MALAKVFRKIILASALLGVLRSSLLKIASCGSASVEDLSTHLYIFSSHSDLTNESPTRQLQVGVGYHDQQNSTRHGYACIWPPIRKRTEKAASSRGAGNSKYNTNSRSVINAGGGKRNVMGNCAKLVSILGTSRTKEIAKI